MFLKSMLSNQHNIKKYKMCNDFEFIKRISKKFLNSNGLFTYLEKKIKIFLTYL